MTRSTLDIALAHSLTGLQTPLQHVLVTYSSMCGIFFFADQSADCALVLRRLAFVAARLERSSDADTKVSGRGRWRLPPAPKTRYASFTSPRPD